MRCSTQCLQSPDAIVQPFPWSSSLRGYDSHLLMQAISNVQGNVSCISSNTEKSISFSFGQLHFIYSAQFLLISLNRSVKAQGSTTMHISTYTNHICVIRRSIRASSSLAPSGGARPRRRRILYRQDINIL